MTDLMSILADPTQRSRLPAGMRNNNPGNIKYVGQRIPGIVGPSVNTDQGDPQAVFSSPEAGMTAMYQLLLKKYNAGKMTPDSIIAGNGGWTPGNHQAAANVAHYSGIGPNDNINLNDPSSAAKFMHGLILQEHGQSGNLYPESMIASAIGGITTSSPSSAPTAVPSSSPVIDGRKGQETISFGSMMPTIPASSSDIPAAVVASATPQTRAHDIFGSLLALSAAQQQQQAPPPPQIQGPSPDQATALLKFVQSLQARRV